MTSVGSSETDENELTVMPCRSPSVDRTVTTVTPVANEAIAPRKLAASTGSADTVV